MDWRTIPWMSFEGGRFLHTYRDLEPDSSVVFKFDAEAYAPFVTRVVGAGEGQVQFDVTLRPAHSITVTVLLPDGRPAASTDIGLVSPDVNLFLVPGGFRHPGRNQGYSESDIAARPLTTDDQGCFNLPDDPAITRVVVPHAEGYAEAPPVRLAVEPTMRLEPWSRLEGTMLSGGKPAVGRLLALTTGPDRAQLTLDPQDYSVETDADGRFVFPKVPPGRLQLRRSTRPRLAGSRADGFASLGSNAGAPRAGGFGSSGVFTIANPITEIEVRPGETKTVMLGAYTVTARVRWPANLQREANWLVGGNVVTPLPNPSATLVSAMPYMPYTSLVEAADGALVAEDLFAGSYEVRVLILDASGKLRAQAQVSMTVPADPPSGTLDLGEIVLQPPQ
jgi:hypothetical protein